MEDNHLNKNTINELKNKARELRDKEHKRISQSNEIPNENGEYSTLKYYNDILISIDDTFDFASDNNMIRSE